MAADQNQTVVIRFQLLGKLLIEHPAAGGQINGMHPLPCLIADMLPAAVQRIGLHHRTAAAAVGVIVHLHLLIGGVVADLVGSDGHNALCLRPADNGLAHHRLDGIGEQCHDVNSHRLPILSSYERA